MPAGASHPPATRKRGTVTRFVVMAMLQAARADRLGLARDSAYSWGLNRAIFYAAAKRGFRGARASPTSGSEKGAPSSAPESYRLGDEEAFRDPGTKALLFQIGEHPQSAEDFQRQIAARFGSSENFRAAWEEAVRIVGEYDRSTLESRRHFFDEVYRPRRDVLSESWSRKYAPPPPAHPPRSREAR